MDIPERTTTNQLAGLIERGEDPQDLWRTDELRAIWKHQLATALTFDLGPIGEVSADSPSASTTAGEVPAKTFGDLFRLQAPPLALLELVKQFGKAHATHPESLLPRDISMALYYGAIAAALVRCGRRISSLNNDTLRLGMQRTAQFDWLDDETRALLNAALES